MSKKNQYIKELRIAHQSAIKCEYVISFKEPEEEYEDCIKKAADKADEISKIRKKIIGDILIDWVQVSGDHVDNLKGLNSSLKGSIKKIKKDVETAQSVVEALGILDDILVVAADIAGGPLG